MIYINDKEVNFIYNLGEKVKEVFSYGTKIWPKEVLFDYMYFKLADGETSGNVSYKFDEYYGLHNKYLKYSTDGNNWSDWTEQISMTPNTKYFVKGEDSYVRNSSISSGFFTSDVNASKFNIECGGNVMSLCNNATEINTNYCFCSLFYNMTNLLTTPELPATTLAANCYTSMFQGCSKLVNAPALPVTTLAANCYTRMFDGCSSLTQAPELPATTLVNYCYSSMFDGCSSLTQAPELPVTTLAEGCYYGMFYGCSSLTQAPELPATTLAATCYYYMFTNCSSLTQAPELPATTLAVFCYGNMFNNCSSLTQAPALPATTLAGSCYEFMFQGCSSLTQAPELPATTLAYGCYSEMFSGCSSLTQAPVLPATTLESYCYNYMFQGCSSLTQAPVLTATTLANNCYESMFFDCTSLTEITLNGDFNSSYAKDWVRNVSSSGTFYNNSDVDIPVGVNGIPAGWKEIKPVTLSYMYFKLADGYTSGNVSYKFDEYYNLHNKYLKISTDGSNWQDWTEAISMEQNVYYCVKGEDNFVRNSNIGGGFFTSDVSQNQFNIKCGGNVMSLCNMATEINTNYCLNSLFNGMTNLVTAPKLPATKLASNCYSSMFNGCSSLTKAPIVLPATTLASNCYNSMFAGCSSLTEAPELPATILTSNCYYRMFYSANKLNWIKALFTDKPQPLRSNTSNWVNGVSSHGVFVKNIEATWRTTGNNAVPEGWEVIYFDQREGKYFRTENRRDECDKYGNPLH